MSPSPEPVDRPADWEAFYRDYRKPGYVAGFEITTKLGGGMFGLVFRARRMSIGKDYAIKFLQVEDEQVRRAVLGELEQVKYFAQIDHPNLVSIEDRGEVDGIPFLVMAFAGTETLRDKMPAGRAPTAAEKDELLRYFVMACRGLAALHERSLVHFDVKPANVFLKGGVARVGDYGLSKLVTHSRGSLSMGRGTPYYMAPELLQRRGDHRSDVYSLGVLLYELLCGKVPFTGDSEWEVLRKHENAAPELPPHLTTRERALLQRCLAKDPAARFQSVHDLIGAFGAPASAGAAAWSELRAAPPAAGAAARTPPAPPRPVGAAPGAPATPTPPPLPGAASGADDPVAGLGRASRDALRHAGTLAQRAAAGAQRVVRDAVERGRTYGVRRYAALRRLKGVREEAVRERALGLAEAIAAGPPRPRRKRSWVVMSAGALLAAMLLVALPWSISSSPRSVGISPTSTASAMAPTGRSERAATFAEIRVPPQFVGYVERSEPRWVDRAGRDRAGAHTDLSLRIARLRAAAPWQPGARVERIELPKFEVAEPLDGTLRSVERRIETFAQLGGDADELGELLARHAPRSLVLVAQQLGRIRWQQPGDLERARRLQQLLEDATGWDEMPVLGDEDTPLSELAVANRTLPTLWLWFLNEFAHTPRTWATFLELRGGR